MTINKSSTSINYIEQLTWLRGFAAFLVIVSHTLRATEVEYLKGDEASSNILMTLLDLGSFGVVLFFVLSGCTLYISLLNFILSVFLEFGLLLLFHLLFIYF